MPPDTLDWAEAAVSLLGLSAIILLFVNQGRGSPILSMVNRWLFWVLFAVGGAYLMRDWELSSRPFWSLAGLFFCAWALLETVYNWVVVSALSRSELRLFPVYRENDAGGEWPNLRRYMKVRQWVRDQGFKLRQSLRAEIQNLLELRSTVYENEERTVRIQALFVPRARSLAVIYLISSRLHGGRFVQTDNLFLPFGGFYPSHWKVNRHPRIRGLQRLLRKHFASLQEEKGELVPFESEPIEDLNEQQILLEKTNVDRGFLNPRYARSEQGILTQFGRYRLWKEIWLMNYFGVSLPTH
jgi:hypothetical protein